MRLSKKQYNEAISRLENLEKTINKGGGNPYHDELGRFTEGPSKAFGEYKADNDLVYGPSANYTGNPKDENNAYRPFAGKVGLADNDIVSTMTKDQVEATMQTMGALRKMKDAVKGISGENWANTPKGIAESALNTLMGYTYTIGYRSSHGKNPEPGEWSDAAWRTHRLDETEASTRALQKVAKANKAYASIAKAATAALNTMKYIEKNTDAKGKEHLYSVSKKTGVTERETPRNSLSSKADNLIAKMDKLINGGHGSGNFGHKGRPGKVGGSGKGGDSLKGQIEDAEDRQKDETRRQNLEQARSEYYRDYLKYERTDDGQYVRKKLDGNDKAYKESLAKIKSLTEEIRKSDAKSDDLQTQKDNVKIDRIEEKIGKKALLVAKDFEGGSLSTFMDEDGNEYWYDKRSERVKDYGGGKEYRSPAFDKAMKDKTPWNEYEITGAQIKSKLKGYGINTDGLSISKGRGGYETAWHISGSGLKTDLKAVEDIVKTKIGHVDYDERSGEILAGGNTYVFVSDKDR